MDIEHYPFVSPSQEITRLCFFSLPAEIRNHIYDLSIPSHRTFVIGPWRPNTQRMQPPLTQVCKQIRHETVPMFVAKNTFIMRASTGSVREESSAVISPIISGLLRDLEVQICPFTEKYKVAIARDLEGIWTWDMDIEKAFHLPRNHFEVWTKWLYFLSTHQNDNGQLRSYDLGTMIRWLQMSTQA